VLQRKATKAAQMCGEAFVATNKPRFWKPKAAVRLHFRKARAPFPALPQDTVGTSLCYGGAELPTSLRNIPQERSFRHTATEVSNLAAPSEKAVSFHTGRFI
jgi:hypothetical protein